MNQWFLLTSGDFDKNHFNTMTVAWGYNGIMWNRPSVVVVVRPTRYTFEFMEKYDTFTLCAFPKEFRDDVFYLGNKSGRDGDKISETNLTAVKSDSVAAPSFEQAELTFECEKIYQDDFKPENFIDKSIDQNYPKKDYHRMYIGEIVHLKAAKHFQF